MCADFSAYGGSYTYVWLNDAVMFFLEQFGRWRRGEALQNVVDKRAGY